MPSTHAEIREQLSRKTEYMVVPFAVAAVQHLLFGNLLEMNGDGEANTEEVNEAVRNIDKLGHWWLIEAAHFHPDFTTVMDANAEKMDAGTYDHTTAVVSYSAMLLGSMGGVFGVANHHTFITDAKHDDRLKKAATSGATNAVKFTAEVDEDGDLSLGYTGGKCPGCGKVHGTAQEAIDALKAKLADAGIDLKINAVEAKVDEQGNITNLDEIPEEIREDIIKAVAEIHAERSGGDKPATGTVH